MSDVKLELTDDMRAEMRMRAEAATPGPWYRTGTPWFLAEDAVLAGSDDGNVGVMIADCDPNGSTRDIYEGDIPLAGAEDDAAHIAAACPANVLALLDERDRLERERDEAREIANHGSTKTEAEWEQRGWAIAEQRKRADTIYANLQEARAALAVEREREHVRELRAALEPFAKNAEAYAKRSQFEMLAVPTTRTDLRRAARLLASYSEGGT